MASEKAIEEGICAEQEFYRKRPIGQNSRERISDILDAAAAVDGDARRQIDGLSADELRAAAVPDGDAQWNAAIEAAAEKFERMRDEARKECCGHGVQYFYDEPEECCGDPDLFIEIGAGATRIRSLKRLK
jgi:hypothetical protein